MRNRDQEEDHFNQKQFYKYAQNSHKQKVVYQNKKQWIKTHMWSTVLYGIESWTMSLSMKRKLEATEMWTWRRMMKIMWTELKSNEESLVCPGKIIGQTRG